MGLGPKPDDNGMPNLDREDEWLPLALAFAVTVSAQWCRDGEVYIPFIDDALVEALDLFNPVYQTVGYNDEGKRLVGYQVKQIDVSEWERIFNSGAKAANHIRARLSVNLENSFPLPSSAQDFLVKLAKGLQNPPAPKKKKSHLHRDTLLAGIAKKVSNAFGVPLGATKTRLSGSEIPICGCTIAASSLFAFGSTVNFPRADDICRNNDLPIGLAAEHYVFAPTYRRAHTNYLAPILPDEFRADASKYSKEYEIAAERLGVSLPRLVAE
jgi:hypothetical protein